MEHLVKMLDISQEAFFKEALSFSFPIEDTKMSWYSSFIENRKFERFQKECERILGKFYRSTEYTAFNRVGIGYSYENMNDFEQASLEKAKKMKGTCGELSFLTSDFAGKLRIKNAILYLREASDKPFDSHEHFAMLHCVNNTLRVTDLSEKLVARNILNDEKELKKEFESLLKREKNDISLEEYKKLVEQSEKLDWHSMPLPDYCMCMQKLKGDDALCTAFYKKDGKYVGVRIDLSKVIAEYDRHAKQMLESGKGNVAQAMARAVGKCKKYGVIAGLSLVGAVVFPWFAELPVLAATSYGLVSVLGGGLSRISYNDYRYIKNPKKLEEIIVKEKAKEFKWFKKVRERARRFRVAWLENSQKKVNAAYEADEGIMKAVLEEKEPEQKQPLQRDTQELLDKVAGVGERSKGIAQEKSGKTRAAGG